MSTEARHAIRACIDRALTIYRRDTEWRQCGVVDILADRCWIIFPAEYQLAHYIWTGRLP